jgi:hypothetical protein
MSSSTQTYNMQLRVRPLVGLGGVPMSNPETSVFEALRSDLRVLSGLPLLALLAVPLVIAFEWGFGNDFTNVFAISRAMLAGFVVPFLLQLAGGAVAARGFGALAATAAALRARIAERSESVAGIAYSRLRARDQWWVSVALGTTAAVLLEQGRPIPKHVAGDASDVRPVIVLSALYMAITTSLVSGLCAALLELGQEFDAIAPAIDRLVDVLTNPLAWISLFVGIGAVRLLMRLGK